MSEYTPEAIAKKIFSATPQAEKTISLITKEEIDNDYSYGFEILLTILFEGLDILIEGLNKLEQDDIDEEHFKLLSPWFKSLGFDIMCYTIDKNDFDNSHYCRVVFNNTSDSGFFIMRNIMKNYHFIKNGNFDITTPHTPDEYTCIMNSKNKIINIYFKPL